MDKLNELLEQAVFVCWNRAGDIDTEDGETFDVLGIGEFLVLEDHEANNKAYDYIAEMILRFYLNRSD